MHFAWRITCLETALCPARIMFEYQTLMIISAVANSAIHSKVYFLWKVGNILKLVLRSNSSKRALKRFSEK